MMPYPGNVGAFGGIAALISAQPTVTASSAYLSGQSVGGVIALANVAQYDSASAFLHSMVILDQSNTKPTGRILIFDRMPTTAVISDHATLTLGSDLFNIVAMLTVAAADYTTINSKAIAAYGNLGLLDKPTSGFNLFAAFWLDGISLPTFTTNQDLKLRFKFVPNVN